MRYARALTLLAFFLLSAGCLTQTYPGVVVGNPDVDDPPSPSKPGEIAPDELPDPSQTPLPSDPQAPDGDPAAPGPIQKEPQEIETARDDAETPGDDRASPDTEIPAPSTRPEHVEFYDEAPRSMVKFQD